MPNFVENVPCRDLSLRLSFVWFYDRPNCPQSLCTKFEVDTFSHCINIKGKPQIFGSFLSPGPRPFLFWVVFLWWTLANLTRLPILKSLPSVIAGLLKGNPQFRGAALSQGHAHSSSACDFMMDFGKPKRHTEFELASFSRCKNSKGEPQNFRELP